MWILCGNNWAVLSRGSQTLRMRTLKGGCFQESCLSLMLLIFCVIFFFLHFRLFHYYTTVLVSSLLALVSSLWNYHFLLVSFLCSLETFSCFQVKATFWYYWVVTDTRLAHPQCFFCPGPSFTVLVLFAIISHLGWTSFTQAFLFILPLFMFTPVSTLVFSVHFVFSSVMLSCVFPG